MVVSCVNAVENGSIIMCVCVSKDGVFERLSLVRR